jgi:hypothetical protein
MENIGGKQLSSSIHQLGLCSKIMFPPKVLLVACPACPSCSGAEAPQWEVATTDKNRNSVRTRYYSTGQFIEMELKIPISLKSEAENTASLKKSKYNETGETAENAM